jgi:hypothetical protein
MSTKMNCEEERDTKCKYYRVEDGVSVDLIPNRISCHPSQFLALGEDGGVHAPGLLITT